MQDKEKKNEYNDTTMDEILSSIRKYVSDESEEKYVENHEEDDEDEEIFIDLEEENLYNKENERQQQKTQNNRTKVNENQKTQTQQQLNNRSSVFNKLTSALRSNKKQVLKSDVLNVEDMSMTQFLNQIAKRTIEEWCERNLRDIVEEIVINEIEKIKSEQ